jgi:hypothetical protein
MSDGRRFDDDVRALYQGPLGEFTAAKQALAKRLKQAGDERAGEVKELRKPSLSAWAVNRLFAVEARAMAAFVGAGERARAAQRRVGTGGDPGPLRQALEAIRTDTPRLLARGVELLAAEERAPGEAIVERVRTNLEALALDPEHSPAAARGWLDADLEPPGFEVMAALQVAASGTKPVSVARGKSSPAPVASIQPARPAPKATVHRLDEGRKAMAKRKEDEREQRLARAREDLARTQAQAAELRQKAQRAAEEADDASRAVMEAERRAVEARRRAKEANDQASRAEAAAARARDALARLERE